MVRHFPRAPRRTAQGRRRRAVAALAAAALLIGPSALPAASADDLEDKQEKVEGQIGDAEETYNESSAELQAATDRLIRAQQDLDDAKAYLVRTQAELAAAEALDRQMQQRLDAAIERLNRAQLALDEGQMDLAEQQTRLRQMVVSAYEQGDPALTGLYMVFTTQDPAQLTGKLNADDAVIEAETTILDQLEAGTVLLQVREAELDEAKADVAVKRREAAANLRRMEALEAQALEAKTEIVRLVQERSDARTKALRAKQADLRVLEELRAEQERIKRLILARTTQARGTTSSLGGAMSWPAEGYITSPFGWRIHPVWGYRSMHDGIDIGAGCGVAVRAPADGTVLETYYHSALGNRIVMDNGVKSGVRIATAYNHLSGFAVSPGAEVRRGDVIGYVGTTGWSTGCHLHFTVLENGAPVDPMTWL